MKRAAISIRKNALQIAIIACYELLDRFKKELAELDSAITKAQEALK